MLSLISCQAQEYFPQSVSKGGMTVNWVHQGDRVFFELQAPTEGWITVGFNDRDDMSDSYLLMGRIINAKAEVVQYYTLGPGNYKPFGQLGSALTLADVSGKQQKNQSNIKFSLPTRALSKFEQSLTPGKDIIMILAYSRDDDFQHHSIMRTSLKVTM